MNQVEEERSFPEVEKEAPDFELIWESDTQAELTKALAAATLEFKEVVKNAENPFFKKQGGGSYKYADLSALIEATREALAKHGIVIMQIPVVRRKTGEAGCWTIMKHASGEWIKSKCVLPVSKWDAQGIGSALTYSRRYAYGAVCNIAGEPDDDGNAAAGREEAKAQAHPRPPQVPQGSTRGGSRAPETWEGTGVPRSDTKEPLPWSYFHQLAERRGRTKPEIKEYLKNIWNVDRARDIPMEHRSEAIRWAKNEAENGGNE